MNLDRFSQPDFKIPAAIFGTLWAAIVLGLLAGNGDFEKIKLVAAVTMVVVFVLFFLRYTWVLGLLICFCGFLQVGFGFTMGDLELSLALAGVFFAATWWRKEHMDRPPVLQHWSFGLFNSLMLLWLAYVAGHTIFNIYEPYRPSEYALKNLLKTVEAWSGPFLMILYFTSRPQHFSVKRDFPRRIAWVLLIAIGVNILIRLFQVLTGAYTVEADPNDPFGNSNNFTIPVLNLMENVYALRAITPTAMLFCGAVVVTQWFKSQTPQHRRLFYLVMALSIVGASLSGGRATLAFVLALFGILLIMQRRFGILLGFFAAAVILVGAVNVVPGTVRNAPPLVRRSLNWALFEKDVDISEQISNSSDWRYALFHRALDEWRSDPRIFWFGRATYSYGVEDVIAVSISGEDASLESALRRGATHNMITDLLVIFGLVGLVLFFSLYFAALLCIWQIYRAPQIDELAKTLALVIFISLSFNFAYGVIGGGSFPTIASWLIAILVSYLYRVNRETELAKPTAKIEPPKARRLSMYPVGGAQRARN